MCPCKMSKLAGFILFAIAFYQLRQFTKYTRGKRRDVMALKTVSVFSVFIYLGLVTGLNKQVSFMNNCNALAVN